MKKLISAVIVNQCNKDGIKEIYVDDKNTIVTSEAKDLAMRYNIKIYNHGHTKPQAETLPDLTSLITKKVFEKIQDPGIDKEKVAELVEKKLKEYSAQPEKPIPSGNDSGIKVVKARSVKLNRFEDAGKDKNVLLADAVTHSDGSPISAGIMSWRKQDSFPWKLTYDEIDYVIEGRLEITKNGEVYSASPGDIVYIPKGSEIIFGTPSSVKILYVTYPANWSEKTE
jgi:ethanolamine utilization protein EutQ